MRRIHRIVMLATLIALAPLISGCTNFNPEKLDVFHLNEKKKLPGKRILLFPNGVPGVTQGIPPQYMKGYEPPADQRVDTDLPPSEAMPGNKATAGKAGHEKTAAVTPVETRPKAKPKHRARRHIRRRVTHKKPKRKTVAKPVTPRPAAQQKLAPWPSAQPQQGSSAPWPSGQPQQGTSAPWPSSAPAKTSSPWPAAPPSGTFSK